MIDRQRHIYRQRLAELCARAAQMEPERSYDWLVLRYRVGQLEAALEWLELCTDWLEEGWGEPGPPKNLTI